MLKLQTLSITYCLNEKVYPKMTPILFRLVVVALFYVYNINCMYWGVFNLARARDQLFATPFLTPLFCWLFVRSRDKHTLHFTV